MKFHSLLNLERFVLEKLSPSGILNPEPDSHKCRILIAQSGKDVKQTFSLMTATCASNELLGRHLDQLYKKCRNLSDTLHSYGAGAGLKAELREEVQIALIELLDYLLEYHDDLLNPALSVSALHLTAAAAGLEEELGRVVSLMKQYHVDQGLQVVIVSKIAKLRDKRKVSWSQIRHLEKIVSYIRTKFNGRFNNANASLCDYLQRSNFNTEAFLLYCKSELDKLLESQLGSIEAFGKLCDLEKTYKTAYYKKRAVPYEPRLPQVKVVLLEYVRAEMDCLRKKERGLARPLILLNAAQSEQVGSDSSGEKLSVGFSVDVLTYFFRLLISTGVVTNPTKASVLRFLSKNVTTRGATDRDISLKSLENKFMLVEGSTRMTTRTVLEKMLQKLEEECA